MGKNKPKKQHLVPDCYLKQWTDPQTPDGQTPYVWVFLKNERKGRKKAPKKLFRETHIFTLELKTGEKDYSIEESLSTLEGKYSKIFREKISKHLPLDLEEHIILCAFVGAMLQRTKRHKKSIEDFFDRIIKKTAAIENHHELQPKQSTRLEKEKKDAHKLSIFATLPAITQMLVQMDLAFLVSKDGTKFITSDDPCNLFNPDSQWHDFHLPPGLAQKNVEVTLPLSPDIKLCMNWNGLRGYINIEKKRIENSNRMARAQCHEEFVVHTKKAKNTWFHKYPMDIGFLIKVAKHKILNFIKSLKAKTSP